MASGTLYEVERIVAKRKNRKGKWEYLIRWKGYGKSEDTWEPKHHLRHCEEFIHQFNRPPVHQDRRSRQGKPSAAPRFLSQAAGVSGGARKRRAVGSQKQRRVGPSKPAGEGLTAVATYGNAPVGLQFVSGANSRCGLQNGNADALRYRDANGAPIIPNNRLDEAREEVRVTEVPLLPELETSSPLSNGGANLHGPMKRQLAEDRGCAFDKRLRYNVRQNESSCRYRDIVVRREEGFTHVLLSSQTSENNALTPEIMKEVSRALGNAAVDDSKLLLLSAVGSIFCGGLDFSHLIGRLSADRRKESARVAEAIRDFVQAFIRFKKPIVVAINGPALGLGASILPLCDIVWASEKAWFQTPYATICLTPVGCSSYTFPQILGVALANDMLFCGRKLTAQEACSRGLVSQVFWPTTFTQEVMLRVKEMAMCSAVVLEESKCLVRNFLRSVLEEVNERECEMLKQLWSSTKGLDTLFTYLQEKAYAV